jgi:hypothetical protein
MGSTVLQAFSGLGLAQHRLGRLLSAGTVPPAADRPGGSGRREGSKVKRLNLHLRPLVMLERSAAKVARCVLRGLGEGDLAWLPGAISSE